MMKKMMSMVYLEQSTDFQERVKACLNLILNYPKLSKEQSRALQLPTKYR